MAGNGADRHALAALRPGAPVADVAAAFGSRWKPPLPHREGAVLVLDMSDGVVARITEDGKLGSIRFNWRFEDAPPVLGLAMSADEAAIRARFPAMKLVTLPMGPFSFATIDEAPALRINLELGTTAEGTRYLRTMELQDPAARYPAKQPVAYPAATAAPGAPFKDANLKLAVLSELIDLGEIDLGDPQDLFESLLGRKFDLDTEGYRPVPAARDYLARFPLTEDLLDKVTSLELDGGATIYPYIEYYWDGESDDYTITSLDGIEALRSLKTVRIISMIDTDKVDTQVLRKRGIHVR